MSNPRLISGVVDGKRRDLLPREGRYIWAGALGVSGSSSNVTDIRPLYVLDLDVDEAVELARVLRPIDSGNFAWQIEAQIPAPELPPEPSLHAEVTLPDGTVETWRPGAAGLRNWERDPDITPACTWTQLHERGTVEVKAVGL